MALETYLLKFGENLWELALDAAPWLLLGLLLAGAIKVCFPPTLLNRWLGGQGFWPVFKAALLGTPLPLCSCSVLPAAMTLHRSGASKGATVSFLIATPENGVDSIMLSYVLLGPFMTVVRPVAAIISAVLAGLLTNAIAPGQPPSPTMPEVSTAACCGSASCHAPPSQSLHDARLRRKIRDAVSYALMDMVDDLAGWLAVSLLLAALIATFVPPEFMIRWGSGLPAMLAMLAVSAPMYICATASTPVAATLLLAGISPGTVLVFLLAGPATNAGTMGIVRKEMGWRVLGAYLVGICGGAVGLGLLTDIVVTHAHLSVVAQAERASELVPHWLAVISVVVLVVAAIRPLRRRIISTVSHSIKRSREACDWVG